MKKVFCILPLFLTGCASMYIPPMSNAPLFEEKGEKQIELAVSSNSFQMSAAYAITDNFAAQIAGNVSYGNISDYNDIFTKEGNSKIDWADVSCYGMYAHKYAEGNVGMYDLLLSEKFKLEAFVGGGYGKADEENFEEKYHNKYAMAYTQINFGQRLKVLDWGASLRLSASFHDFDWTTDDSKSFSQDFTMFHIEPSAFCRIGGEHIRFVPRIGLSLPIKTSDFTYLEDNIKDSDFYRTTLIHFSLGVHFSF